MRKEKYNHDQKKLKVSTINFYAECCDAFINISMTTSNIERAKEILDIAYEQWMQSDINIPLDKYLIQVLWNHGIECNLEEGGKCYAEKI